MPGLFRGPARSIINYDYVSGRDAILALASVAIGAALVLGGGEDIKYVSKGDAYTHQHLLLELGK